MRAAIFTWLTGYSDPTSKERQGAQEANDGRIRAFTKHADGTVEYGRWFQPPRGLNTAPLTERGIAK